MLRPAVSLACSVLKWLARTCFSKQGRLVLAVALSTCLVASTGIFVVRRCVTTNQIFLLP